MQLRLPLPPLRPTADEEARVREKLHAIDFPICYPWARPPHETPYITTDLGSGWTRRGPRVERFADASKVAEVERSMLGMPTARRLGFWIDDLPRLVDDLLLLEYLRYQDRSAFRDLRTFLRWKHALYVVVDPRIVPDLHDWFRELRWRRAAWRARKLGGELPHLLDFDRFSIDGYNFEVGAVRDTGIRVALLDEDGQPCTGTVINDHVEVAPPVATPKSLPTSARGRLNLAARLTGDVD